MSDDGRARVTGEYYRIVYPAGAGKPSHVGPYPWIQDACYHAMRLMLATGELCAIERVTEHEPVLDVWGFETVTETVTGRASVQHPQDLARHYELSRYHPVYGWAVPETIDPYEDDYLVRREREQALADRRRREGGPHS